MAGGDGSAAPGFHYRSAPVYLLTLVVGLLFAADIAAGQLLEAGVSTWGAWQSVAGMRLALIAAVLGGSRILFQTLEGLFDGRVGADLALTIACLAAIVLGEHTTAALVVFIALCGESLEGYTIDRAQRAIRNVFNLCPAIAHVVEDGTERDVPLSDIEPGMVVAVRPGERIPVDGVITAGRSSIDQSALTGEALPVDRVAGDEVHAGTLNQFGALEIETRHVGERTVIGQVLQLVAEAAEQKAPLERAADRYAKLFLPVVLGAALCTLIGWRFAAGTWQAGFLPALSVLVVACPCPLILATPAAVMSAMAWLAREGVVVKGSAALERLATVDTIAFDKTGTLTQGRFQISSLLPVAAPAPEELLRVAAIAERRSEHLIARILCRTAQEQGHILPGVHNFEALPGSGVIAEITPADAGPWACELAERYALAGPSGRMKIVVGNQRLFEQFPFEFDQTLNDHLKELDTRGETTLIVGVLNPAIPMLSPASSADQVPTATTAMQATARHHSGIVLGVVGVSDQLRESARGVLLELRRAGITGLAMLTGDRESAAKKVVADLEQFQTCEAQLLPADKAEWIRQAIGRGHQVAMVGDGVNDAPALATASVGIALGKAGSDIAAEAGDLILMGDPLRPLPGLLRLSRRLVRTIQQSIYLFAFGLNGLGMILGATSILSPGAAAIFHEVASLAVMVNSLRLLWFERGDSNWMSRSARRVQSLADHIVLLLSPAQLVFRTIRVWKLLLRMSLAGLALLWFLSGLILLEPDEAAVVKRFGAFEDVLEPGPHWRWPVPFEEVRREQVDRVRVVQIGFRTDEDIEVVSNAGDAAIAFRQGPVEWTSEHSRSGAADLHADESLTLTGNELPVEITLEVQFHIGDLRQYCHNAADPDSVLRVLTESAARQVLARCSLDDVLTIARLRIERELHSAIADSTADYQLGVVIDAVALLDVHPPRQVVPAYRQVADAEELRQQLINEADAYYSRTTLAAAGSDAVERLAKPARPVLDADHGGEAGRAVSAAQLLSDQEWKSLIQERADGSMLLAGEAAARLHTARRDQTARVSKAAASAARFESITPVYQRQPALTGLAVYLKAVADALAGRPLLIVDPSVAGRQHILLADPQQPAVGNAPGAWLLPPASDPENPSTGDEDQLPRGTETAPGDSSQQLQRSDP